MEKQSRSPWVWVGCGCATIVGIGLIVIGVVVYFGIQTAKTMADPDARRDKALATLSAGAIPNGYETQLAMKVPFYAEIVLLEGDGSEFVFLEGLRTGGDLKAAFADEESFDEQTRRAGLQLRSDQKILAKDGLHVGAAEIRYVLVEGGIRFDFDGKSGNSSVFDFNFSDLDDSTRDVDAGPKLGAAILMRCSEDDDPGLGLWMGPRTDPEDTAADQAALVDFIEQFRFCDG